MCQTAFIICKNNFEIRKKSSVSTRKHSIAVLQMFEEAYCAESGHIQGQIDPLVVCSD